MNTADMEKPVIQMNVIKSLTKRKDTGVTTF